jgi:hypothetical protein
MSEREKRTVAYHEAGHAIVGHALPNADPVHKITIIPRGQALGFTMQLPTEDKYLISRSELIDRLAVMLGGRVAEEIKIGDITTGAGDDIRKATATAKEMVTQYGMSSTKLGPITLGQRTRSRSSARSSGTPPTTPGRSRSRSTRRSATSSTRPTTRRSRSSSRTTTCSRTSRPSCSRSRPSTATCSARCSNRSTSGPPVRSRRPSTTTRPGAGQAAPARGAGTAQRQRVGQRALRGRQADRRQAHGPQVRHQRSSPRRGLVSALPPRLEPEEDATGVREFAEIDGERAPVRPRQDPAGRPDAVRGDRRGSRPARHRRHPGPGRPRVRRDLRGAARRRPADVLSVVFEEGTTSSS